MDRAQKLRGERLQKQAEKEKRRVEVAVHYHAGFPPTSVSLPLRLCVYLFMSLCLAGHLISTPWMLELMSGSELDHQCSIWKVQHLKCTD